MADGVNVHIPAAEPVSEVVEISLEGRMLEDFSEKQCLLERHVVFFIPRHSLEF